MECCANRITSAISVSESRGLSALQVVQRKKEKRRANNKRLKKFQLLGVELIQDAHGNGGNVIGKHVATASMWPPPKTLQKT